MSSTLSSPSIPSICDTVFLKTAYAPVSSTDSTRWEKCTVLFDDCSQRTYVSRRLAMALKLKPLTQKTVIINGTCATSSIKKCDVVQLKVQTLNPAINICITGTVLDEICHPIKQQPVCSAVRKFPHLKGLKLADYHRDNATLQVDLLVGADHYYEFVSDTIRRGRSGEPVAVSSKLGWLISGPMAANTTNTFTSLTSLSCFESQVNAEKLLHDLLQKSWDLETVGIDVVVSSTKMDARNIEEVRRNDSTAN